jgi:6-phosphogluconate dehydrogenase
VHNVYEPEFQLFRRFLCKEESYMELGMAGLGRMGTSMVRRLLRAGHQCVVYDLNSEAVQVLVKEGALGTNSLEEFASKLKMPRAVWMMVPAAVVDPTLTALIPFLAAGDAIIGGGNSYYPDDIRRAAELKPKGSAALYARFSSRGEDDFAGKVLSALRYQFGGHEEKAEAGKAGE